MTTETETVYALCPRCAHVEPRPAHAEDDWFPCESCGWFPELYRSREEADDASETILECD